MGTSKIGPKFRITLVKDVQEKLGAKIGDMIVYLELPDGNVVIKVVSYNQLLKATRR